MAAKTVDWERHIGRHLKIRELYILSVVVDQGSMVKAAAHLAMSQSAVSEAIANFEGTLGVQLLDRNPRGVEPTNCARAILDRGRIVFNELRQGLTDIEFLSDPAAGEIRLGAPESLSAGMVAAIIERLGHDYPKIRVHVIQANTASLEFRGLRDRSLDLMIGRIPRDLHADDMNLQILFEDNNFVVAGLNSKWTRRRKIALNELAREPWILPSSSNVMSILIDQLFQAQGLPIPENSMTSNSIHLRMHLLATGRYISLLPGSVLRYNAARWSLKALPVAPEIEPRPVAIVTLKNRTLSPVVRLFIEHAREVAKHLANNKS